VSFLKLKEPRPEVVAAMQPAVEAAGTVRLSTTTPGLGWGVGIARLAPAAFDSRARDLICSAIGALPLTLWTINFGSDGLPVEKQSPPAPWMARPDPDRTRQFVLAWTADDLLFTGRAFWLITSRYANSFPASFRWLPSADVSVDSTGRVTYLGHIIPPEDIVEFLSPIQGLLFTGWRAISTAINLDNAAERFSFTEIPAGWLEQVENSEPLDGDELADIASQFQVARNARTIAALNPFMKYRESSMDPSKLQLVEARQYQAVELARIANIPAYFLNAPAGTGMTYLNAQQAKQDLIDFGAMPYIGCIEQTLGGPNVTPRGQFVRLDTNAWLRNPFNPTNAPSQNDVQIAYNPQPAPPADQQGPQGPQNP
jgi:hypothetical protein